MFITADALLAHAIGDYIIQSDKMAQNKQKSFLWALIHSVTYSIPFLFLDPSLIGYLTIVLTHAIIDHFGLAKYVIFFRNWIWDKSLEWKDCKVTGFHYSLPGYLSKWLLIIVDNILHIIINGIALKFL